MIFDSKFDAAFPINDKDEYPELLRRAQILAQKLEGEDVSGNFVDVLEFQLTGERYAFELTGIKEVIFLKEFTPLPYCPDFLMGIFKLRGEVVPLIDIRKFFELPGTPLSDLNRIIIISDEAMKIGVMTDRIYEIQKIRKEDIHHSLLVGGDYRDEFTVGVTSSRLIILDATKLLKSKKLFINITV